VNTQVAFIQSPLKKLFGSPGQQAWNKPFEPPTDNKTVRQPGAEAGEKSGTVPQGWETLRLGRLLFT
jgi:hypothetical protein